MEHIQIYDNVLSQENCDNIIKSFDQHPLKRQGVLGKSLIVDKSRKDSEDICLDFLRPRSSEEQIINHIILDTLNECIVKYKKKL